MKHGCLTMICRNFITITWLLVTVENLDKGLACYPAISVKDQLKPTFVISVPRENFSFEIVRKLYRLYDSHNWIWIKNLPDTPLNRDGKPKKYIHTKFVFLGSEITLNKVNDWLKSKSGEMPLQFLSMQPKAYLHALTGIIPKKNSRSAGGPLIFIYITKSLKLFVFFKTPAFKTLRRCSSPTNSLEQIESLSNILRNMKPTPILKLWKLTNCHKLPSTTDLCNISYEIKHHSNLNNSNQFTVSLNELKLDLSRTAKTLPLNKFIIVRRENTFVKTSAIHINFQLKHYECGLVKRFFYDALVHQSHLVKLLPTLITTRNYEIRITRNNYEISSCVNAHVKLRFEIKMFILNQKLFPVINLCINILYYSSYSIIIFKKESHQHCCGKKTLVCCSTCSIKLNFHPLSKTSSLEAITRS